MTKKDVKYHTASFWVLLVGSFVALIASFVLSFEELLLIQNPDAVLSCSFNLVLNCSTVMQSAQATFFGDVPNMFLGLMAFPVIITVAVAALWGRARYSRGFLQAMTIGVALGTIFSYWLFFNSLYVIQVLCPWCLVVTTSCTFLLAATLHIGLRENIFRLSSGAMKRVNTFLDKGYHQAIVAGWLLLMVALVILKFGEDLLG